MYCCCHGEEDEIAAGNENEKDDEDETDDRDAETAEDENCGNENEKDDCTDDCTDEFCIDDTDEFWDDDDWAGAEDWAMTLDDTVDAPAITMNADVTTPERRTGLIRIRKRGGGIVCTDGSPSQTLHRP
jgi:hypothetical protein